jgi:hypothetical protein
MLRKPGLPEEPALPHSAAADRHPSPEAAAGHDGLLLRTDEVHHRGQGPSELRSAGGVQRKVFLSFEPSYCSLMLTADGLNSMKITSLFVMLTNTSCKMCFY